MTTPYLTANLQDYPSLQDKVYDHIKQAILAGEIQPGERLLETHLAQSLGVSRIPVREAIRKLEREGLIVVIPRRGVYASSINARDLDEVYAIRAVLEGLAARLAATNRTPEQLTRIDAILSKMVAQSEKGDTDGIFFAGRDFHEAILDAAGNEKLQRMMDLLHIQIERVRSVRMRVNRHNREVVSEYQRIRNAIADGSSNLAETEMRAHIEKPRQDLVAIMQHTAAN